MLLTMCCTEFITIYNFYLKHSTEGVYLMKYKEKERITVTF
jgi:hypothetical protein